MLGTNKVVERFDEINRINEDEEMNINVENRLIKEMRNGVDNHSKDE